MKVSFNIDGWVYLTYSQNEKEQLYNILSLISDSYEEHRNNSFKNHLFMNPNHKNELLKLINLGGMEID